MAVFIINVPVEAARRIKNCAPLQFFKDIVLLIVRSLVVLMALGVVLEVHAAVADTVSVRLHYRQGCAVVDPDYRGNDSVIERLRSIADIPVVVSSIELVSSASPEGTAHFNRSLSARRSAAALAIIKAVFGTDTVPVEVRSIGVDWEGLMTRLREGDRINNSDSIYPELRVSKIKIVTNSHEVKTLRRIGGEAIPIENMALSDSVKLITHTQVQKIRHTSCPRLALSTNLLYDAAVVPTLSAHLLLHHGLVVSASGMYAWWGGAIQGRYWRAQGVGLSLRRYLSTSEAMSGHHLGVYGEVFRYDFSVGSKGQLSGGAGTPFTHRPTWTVGVDYGYSVRLGSRFRLDLALGVGYMTGRYMTYRIADGHSVWQSTRHRHYFGPTKAEASIVWIIGKGGAR